MKINISWMIWRPYSQWYTPIYYNIITVTSYEEHGVSHHRQPLQWRHNMCEGVSVHQPHDYLLNHLFRRRSKKTSKLRLTGLCAGNSPVTGEFPAQRASNAENVPFDGVIMVSSDQEQMQYGSTTLQMVSLFKVSVMLKVSPWHDVTMITHAVCSAGQVRFK